MPRRKKNARPVKHGQPLRTRKTVKIIDAKNTRKDDISPGRLVCAAEHIGLKVVTAG